MAAVTHEIATASTSNVTSYASGAFTPAANDLLVAFVVASATVAAGTMTSSVGGQTFSKVTSFVYGGSVSTIYAFVSDQLVGASSQTVTFDCTGDAATGAVIFVVGVSGMSRTGLTAILQSAGQSNQGAGGTPAPAFGASAQTGNPTLGLIGNSTSPAGLTPPTSWTEDAAGDTGYSTPTTGAEYVYRNSGFTGTTITWGSTSATAFASLILELDTTAAPSSTHRGWLWSRGGWYGFALVSSQTLVAVGSRLARSMRQRHRWRGERLCWRERRLQARACG